MSDKNKPGGADFGLGPRQPKDPTFAKPLGPDRVIIGNSLGPRQPKAPDVPDPPSTGKKK